MLHRRIPSAAGVLDWRTELDDAFTQIDAQSTGPLAACLVEPSSAQQA